ncbi:MAG TPA: PLP-dependent aminotransferase family protein [Dongiaceae bacterium]|nr:PLP-dependent aminotransferase family protein [Dongiaceae bacterium]
MREQLFHLDPKAGSTLQTQLRQMLVAAIREGQLPPGSALPSCRRLAESLEVARNTVALAYQDLVEEGFLIARQRSGYFVSREIDAGRLAPPPGEKTAMAAAPDWLLRLRCRPSTQRNIVKPRNWQDYRYPFIYGQVDPALFPIADWRECSRQALSLNAVREWSSDRFTDDDPQLIEQIRTLLLPRRGVFVTPEEILLTVGAQHAIYLLSTLLVDDRTVVGIEDPGYADARNIFALRTSRLIGLPVDDNGLMDGAALDGCTYVHVTPSHQFPTTVTMSLGRRRALIERAARQDIVFIEDDYEAEINHLGRPTPALKSLDPGGRVVFVGSLSKTIAPGLRMGYLVGAPELIAEARALRRLMLRHPPANNQRTAALFLARGHYDSLLRREGQSLKQRWSAMQEALARHMTQCRFRQTSGGTAFWIEGPPSLDARVLEKAAAALGVLIEPGDVHFLSDVGPRNFFRLGFSSIPAERIEPGIRLLAQAIRDLTPGAPESDHLALPRQKRAG